MASDRIKQLVEAPAGKRAVLQGNIAFALGCARGGIHAADGYPGTPSTEVIDKGLSQVQDLMRVGWSVNEANAVGLGFGCTLVGADALVTMKIPGLFQAADVVATLAGYTARRGGLVLFVASDFVPSSTQYVFDPRYFLKSCFVPVLEPRDHQEMLEAGPLAAALGREHAAPVVVLANGLLCHSEGVVRLGPNVTVPRLELGYDFRRFMNLPEIARRSYDEIHASRMPALRRLAEKSPLNRVERNDPRLGVVVHGVTELYLREVWDELPAKPSVLSLGITWPLPGDKVRAFVESISGRVLVLGDGYRFVQEELLAMGLRVEGKDPSDPTTEWTPEAVARLLGAERRAAARPSRPAPVRRPATICAGCPYRAFGLVVQKLRKKKKIVASFGDIGCNTLLYFLDAVDTCMCMGAADNKRQGVVLADPSLAGKTISVIGDSTECHTGLDSTRNAVFHGLPGVKVVLDNFTTAMTGGQPAPTSPTNLAGKPVRFDLVAALEGEGARVRVLDAFDMKGIEAGLRAALEEAAKGAYTVLVIRGPCILQVPADKKPARFEIDLEACKKCDLCLVCSGLERDAQGFPRFTHLCTGCGEAEAVCVQRCNLDAIVLRREATAAAAPPPPPAHEETAGEEAPVLGLPRSIRLAVRGVGGQGNLFLGKVLAELALVSGYERVVKGETHGMAQLGGAVMSTFGCGQVSSPVLAPGTADVLVALEMSEALRPGFLELLKPGGTVLLNALRVVPTGVEEADYPSLDAIRGALAGCHVVEIDALAEARAIGDVQGRSSNVVALGTLSAIAPLSLLPAAAWRKALRRASPSEAARRANIAAFERGRDAASRAACAAPTLRSGGAGAPEAPDRSQP
jgi:indolepyruvate ferredoxin oxidoreductase alpha subunit